MSKIEYNTQRKRLSLPEYGRSIQRMVDYALTLEDRAERQRCAETIIRVMDSMFPELRQQEDYKRKLWDQLAIMSDFKLDIDYPFEIVKKDDLAQKPARVPYPQRNIHFRHYGLLVERALRHVEDVPEGPERDRYINLIASQMKRNLAEWNINTLNDVRVLNDLNRYLGGRVAYNPDNISLDNVLIDGPRSDAGKMKAKKAKKRTK